MNEPVNPLELHKEAIARIFTYANVQPILEVLRHCRPLKSRNVKESEFETIVNAAKEDAYDDLMESIVQFIINNNAEPRAKVIPR
jgi:ribosomal protein S3AE